MPAIGLISALLGILGGAVGLSFAFDPIRRQLSYSINAMFPNTELEVNDLITLYFRGFIALPELIERLKKYGYDEVRARELLVASKRLFNIEQTIYAYRRKIIDDYEFKDLMKANGVKEDDIEKFVKITEYFPSISDIINFFSKEVFTKEIVEAYGYGEEMPQQFLDLCNQIGIPLEWAKILWFAHWRIPDIQIAFEMFRRGIINKDELLTLMRVHNIAPGWREKLVELAYEIPARVDIRRMFEVGVITREEAKEYFLKFGFKEKEAELLTKWLEIEYAYEDKTLTVKQILELFELGEFTKEEAIEYLRKLGYRKEVAEYKVILYEHERLLKEAKEMLNLLIEQYKVGIITWEELVDEAYKLPFSPTTIKRALTKAYREKEAKVKLPSLNTLKKWLKLQIISLDEFKDYLRRMGYEENIIENYVKEVTNLSLEQIQTQGE